MNRIGRNAPCPCGSGKKYKKCCQDKHVEKPVDFLWRKLRAMDDQLVHKLLKHAKSLYGYEGLYEAWEDFSGGEAGEFDIESPHSQAFFPWYLYNWRPDTEYIEGEISNDPTIAESYLNKHQKRLSEIEIRFIQLTGSQPDSFHEVIACTPGEGFKLKDILLGNEVDVIEHLGSQAAQRGDIFFARVMQFDHVGLMVGSGSILIPPSSKPDIIHLRTAIRSQTGSISVDDLHEWDSEIRELYFAIYTKLHAPPQWSNTDGDPLCMHELFYEIDSPQYAFDQLKSLAVDVEEEELLSDAQFDADGQVQRVEIPWLKRGNPQIESFGNTALGHIKIEGRQLRVSVNSENRAGRIKKEIEFLLKNHVTYKVTEIQSITSLLNDAEKKPNLTKQKELASFNAQPEVQERLAHMMDAHWEQWVKEKLPVLGDQTPFEAVNDPDGREIIIALLDDMERHDQKKTSGIEQQKYIDRARQQLRLC